MRVTTALILLAVFVGVAAIGYTAYRTNETVMLAAKRPPAPSPSVFEGKLKPDPELELRASMRQKLWSPGSAAGLELIEKEIAPLRDGRIKSPSGIWQLRLFYVFHDNAIRDEYTSAASREHFDKVFDEWKKTNSKSKAAWMIRAAVLTRIAKNAYAELLKPHPYSPSRPVLEANLKAATAALDKYLDEIKFAAGYDPHWYVDKIISMSLPCAPEAERWMLLDEASAKYPDYTQIYFEYIDRGIKCGGDAKTLARKVIDLAVDRSKATDGQSMYARLYWKMSSAHTGPGLFASDWIDWPRMKQGMDDILQRYPDPWNVNNFAFFACAAQDAEKTRELTARAAEHPVASAWPSAEAFSYCRDWANRTASSAAAAPQAQ